VSSAVCHVHRTNFEISEDSESLTLLFEGCNFEDIQIVPLEGGRALLRFPKFWTLDGDGRRVPFPKLRSSNDAPLALNWPLITPLGERIAPDTLARIPPPPRFGNWRIVRRRIRDLLPPLAPPITFLPTTPATTPASDMDFSIGQCVMYTGGDGRQLVQVKEVFAESKEYMVALECSDENSSSQTTPFKVPQSQLEKKRGPSRRVRC